MTPASDEAPACAEPVPIYRAGLRDGTVCPEDAAARGLTVVDLSEGWVPRLFAEDPAAGEAGRQPYRATYLALAREDHASLPRDQGGERYVELFGIFPTFEVLAERLAETERHDCHAAVDDPPASSLPRTLRPWGRSLEAQELDARRHQRAWALLAAAMEERGLSSPEALRGASPTLDAALAVHRELGGQLAAVRAVQAHLRCDGLLPPQARDGVHDGFGARALRLWQRRHLLTSSALIDRVTLEAMAGDSREADFRAVLRALRERVTDATGLLEDGSAAHGWRTVLGRHLEPAAFRATGGHGPAPDAAPDLVAAATEAAARALGWTSADRVLAALGGELDRPGRVALPLPPVPAYHSRHMDLRAVIDRGDVSYDVGGRGRVRRRPVITLYARHGGRDVALARWVTTIGGWKEEVDEAGRRGRRYKESPPGPRVWRELWAAPAWLPPPSTPDSELVRRVGRARWEPRRELFGPGHRSAYGLAMLVHERPLPSPDADGAQEHLDEGIRTHGSVSYGSILDGESHGCHRLHNHLAVRLASFLLAHRSHVRRGPQRVHYGRVVRHHGVHRIRIGTRGTLFELSPPVPVLVTAGDVVSERPRASRQLLPLRRR